MEHGYKVTAIDNLDNAFEEVLNRLKKLAGDKADNLNFVKVITACFLYFNVLHGNESCKSGSDQ